MGASSKVGLRDRGPLRDFNRCRRSPSHLNTRPTSLALALLPLLYYLWLIVCGSNALLIWEALGLYGVAFPVFFTIPPEFQIQLGRAETEASENFEKTKTIQGRENFLEHRRHQPEGPPRTFRWENYRVGALGVFLFVVHRAGTRKKKRTRETTKRCACCASSKPDINRLCQSPSRGSTR